MKINAKTVVGLLTGETVQPGIKYAINVKKTGHFSKYCHKKMGDNPITSHLGFQEPAKLQPKNPTIS